MLETVREYGLGRLEAISASNRVHATYAMIMRDYVRRASTGLSGPQQLEWLERIEGSLSNLRAALKLALDRQETAIGVSIVVEIGPFWVVRDHVSECLDWLTAFLALPAEPEEKLQALLMLVDLYWGYGDYPKALETLSSVRALGQETGTLAAEADAVIMIGSALVDWSVRLDDRMEMDRAIAVLSEGLQLAQAVQQPLRVAKARSLLTMARWEQDESTAAAIDVLSELVVVFRELGDLQKVCVMLGNRGMLSAIGGEFAVAQRALGSSLLLARQLDYRWWKGFCLVGAAAIDVQFGRDRQAAELLAAASMVRRETGIASRAEFRRTHDALAHGIERRIGAQRFQAAWTTGEHRDLARSVAIALMTCEVSSLDETSLSHLSRREREIANLAALVLTDLLNV